MPFSKTKKIIKKGHVSLQVQKQRKYNSKASGILGKRAVPSACAKNNENQASITVEAAIAMILFIAAVVFMANYIVITHAESSSRGSMDSVVRQVAKNMFYVEMADEVYEDNVVLTGDGKNEDSVLSEIMGETLITTLDDAVSAAFSAYKLEDLNISKSTFSDGMVDIVATRTMNAPLLNTTFTLGIRSKAKDWTGRDLTETGTIVYITKTGSVYHTSRQCSHLILSTKKATAGELETLRNNSGAKYKPCSHCVDGTLGDDTVIFVTDNGTKYHTDIQCKGITRSVIAIDMKEVGDRRPCSTCAGGGQ